jgi:hypothetical protein
MPKMGVYPLRANQNGETLVNVYDMQRVNNQGGIYLVAFGIPEAVAKEHWDTYLRRRKTGREEAGQQ